MENTLYKPSIVRKAFGDRVNQYSKNVSLRNIFLKKIYEKKKKSNYFF